MEIKKITLIKIVLIVAIAVIAVTAYNGYIKDKEIISQNTQIAEQFADRKLVQYNGETMVEITQIVNSRRGATYNSTVNFYGEKCIKEVQNITTGATVTNNETSSDWKNVRMNLSGAKTEIYQFKITMASGLELTTSFNQQDLFPSNNTPPNKPVITLTSNKSRLVTSAEITITASCTDEDLDKIEYVWDGRTEETAYYTEGEHTVRVKAIDIYGEESAWSEVTFNVVDILSDIIAIRSRMLNGDLCEVDYRPTELGNSTVVTIPASHSGIDSEQNFTQNTLGAMNLKWYVLNIDDENITLVSDVTSDGVSFNDFSGYDNCLYYLNELSTRLFINDTYGITENDVHAFRLTDIKEAAEASNEGLNDWGWDSSFIANVEVNGWGTLNQPYPIPYERKYSRYPKIYGTQTGAKVINNVFFDEEVGSIGNLIAGDTGIQANSLQINNTAFTMQWQGIGHLGNFGKSSVAKNLFDENSEEYWLASRIVWASDSSASYGMRIAGQGRIAGYAWCTAGGVKLTRTLPFRVTVTISRDRVYVEDDGSIELVGDSSYEYHN